jgi:hypothetical protein
MHWSVAGGDGVQNPFGRNAHLGGLGFGTNWYPSPLTVTK